MWRKYFKSLMGTLANPSPSHNAKERGMEPVMGKEKENELEDTNLVAYLHYCGFRFSPVQKDNGRVSFIVYGDITEKMAEMYKDPQVRLLEFVKCLKAVRSSMFNLRKLNET